MSHDHREAIAEVLAEHQAVATGLGEWACKCSPTEWRPTAYRSTHQADALLGSDVLAQIRAEARAEALDAEFGERIRFGIEKGALTRYALAKAWDEGLAVGMDDDRCANEENPYRAEGSA